MRREDVAFHKGTLSLKMWISLFERLKAPNTQGLKYVSAKSVGDDLLQCNNAPSSRTKRGHQTPGAFLLLASGLEKVWCLLKIFVKPFKMSSLLIVIFFSAWCELWPATEVFSFGHCWICWRSSKWTNRCPNPCSCHSFCSGRFLVLLLLFS